MAETVETTTTETPAEPVVEETLAEHEAQFAPQPRNAPVVVEEDPPALRERDDDGKFRTKHRAKSQQATAEDVTLINELTKRARAAEDAAGIEKKPGESQRVYELRRRAELAEARKTPAPVPITAPARVAVPEPVKAVSEPLVKPDPEKFTYGTADPGYLEALADWKVEQRFKADADARAETEKTAKNNAEMAQITASFKTAVDAAKLRHADFEDVALKAPTKIPQGSVMDVWIMKRPAGPEVLYYLQQHDDERARIAGISDALEQVETLTLLGQRLLAPQAASTGSAASASAVPVPRPPNPVRTGPSRPSETPPGDGSSLSDHERYYGSPQKRR